MKDGGFFLCHWDGTEETEAKIKEDTQEPSVVSLICSSRLRASTWLAASLLSIVSSSQGHINKRKLALPRVSIALDNAGFALERMAGRPIEPISPCIHSN